LEEQLEKMDEKYIPIDFEAYSIEDPDQPLNPKAKFEEDDRIWRISSITAFIDDETKILLLPLPESKRKTKIKDTKFELENKNDLIVRKLAIETDLTDEGEERESKKFEDMTQGEIQEEIKRKR
jgi:hypothetical protein